MSEGHLRITAAALALAGIGISVYLSVTWYADTIPACVGGSHGCAQVQNSDYADLSGVPIALLGGIGYAAILVSLALPGELGRMSGALMALVAFGFSLYLTYLEVYVIEAICQWCVASAVVTALLAAVTVTRLLRAPPETA